MKTKKLKTSVRFQPTTAYELVRESLVISKLLFEIFTEEFTTLIYDEKTDTTYEVEYYE